MKHTIQSYRRLCVPYLIHFRKNNNMYMDKRLITPNLTFTVNIETHLTKDSHAGLGVEG